MNCSSATIWNDEGHKVATTHYYDSPSNRHDRFIIEDSLKLLAEVKRLREESKKQLGVISTLDEMIRNEESHVEMMKALEQGLDLPETWKEMIE